MPWIESNTSLEKHPKLIRLQTAMRWSRNETVGFLHRFWWTVLEVSPSGDVTALSSPEVMAETLNMKVDLVRDAFKRMEEVGLLDRTPDGKLIVHDWLDYTGLYLSQSKYKRNPKRMDEIRDVHKQSKDCPRTVLETRPTRPDQPDQIHSGVDEVLEYLNQKTGKKFRPVPSHTRLINARISEGYTVDDIKRAIDGRVTAWAADHKMSRYLRPETLFNATKFQSYVNDSEAPTRPGEPGYQLTDAGRVVVGFKKAKGIPKEDKAWNLQMFDAQLPNAQRLLDYFDGSWERAVECLAWVAEKRRGMEWGWQAVMNLAPEFKNGKVTV